MFGLLRRSRARLLYVFSYRINQVDLISGRGQPAGVDTGAAACVDDGGGSGRQVAKNQLPRARLLELKPGRAEARRLIGAAVVTNNPRRGIGLWHGSLADR